MIKIEATEQEVQALAGLIDAAVKSIGLRAAPDAALWGSKLNDALSVAKEDKTEETNGN